MLLQWTPWTGLTLASIASVSAAGYFVGSDTWTGFLALSVCVALSARRSWKNVKIVSKDCVCDWISIERMRTQHEASKAEAAASS